jgi:hypothetical protein
MAAAFNPLTVPNLALALALELLEQPVNPLPPKASFPGAGIYAIYYLGDFAAYAELVRRNDGESYKAPIYVGRAVRPGSRKGIQFSPSTKASVYPRLNKHANSIQATALSISDFRCRYLIVEDAFIDLAESVLISLFRPVWNQVVDGFGNNPTGGPRASQRRSDWEVLHPGRARGKGKEKRSNAEIVKSIEKHFKESVAEQTDADLRRIAERVRKYTHSKPRKAQIVDLDKLEIK